MHKRLVNHCTIDIGIEPYGPILVKPGREGADPTKPDMEFVETYHQNGRSIYLPGSSLKGAIRAHAERIVRTVGRDRRPSDPKKLWASDPLDLDGYKYLDDLNNGKDIYKQSSFTDQMFGSIAIASRIRIEDAYPAPETGVKTEERNGVAIDRVFGSVAVGPFNFQVCTAGKFKTKIHLKNFTLAQLGLIGLVLRDLNEGWFGLGFAKSRGLGMVKVNLKKAIVQYPGCILDGEEIQLIGSDKKWSYTSLLGAGMFLNNDEPDKELDAYGFPPDDFKDTPIAAQIMDLGIGVQLTWESETVSDLFRLSVEAWREQVLQGASS